ncbi:M3 family oligoendopeptidase [Alteribacter keqinensis]|uniref:M3 family oligoendopeptidase n=1 Tax=Alteribacter keqinensis TaxID=2483800 RepID=A0A3M7TVJ6_9BACI|nr:M3 family oligoendopeptidase [Alteribacter keqinensis]RNA69281.1 M3 family oligoendopeptidase [Alteribacter keqinensis]
MMKYYVEKYDFKQADKVEHQLRKLLERPVTSVEDLEKWLVDQTEVYDAIEEALSGHYIDFQCYSHSEKAKEAFEYDQKYIEPMVKRYEALLDNKFFKNEYKSLLDTDVYGEFIKSKENAKAIFRDENVDLEIEEDRLATRYFEITGSLTVDWDGDELTLSQAKVHLKSSDRETRKKAATLIMEAVLSEEAELQLIMDDLIKLRQKKAENAGLSNYRDYMFKKYERFDYTPKDCKALMESVRKHARPIQDHLLNEQKGDLGVDSLRFWDLQGVPNGQTPLKPYETRNELVEGTKEMLNTLNPRFGELLSRMDERGMLDLSARKGKAPGGFCTTLPVSDLSFIFMNEARHQDDLVTLIHEMGHCIHNDYKKDLPVGLYRDTPSESAELASMTMELFTMDQWDRFYKNEEDLKRAKKEQFSSIIDLLTQGMVVDQFQHWLYENPEHTKEERNSYFENLSNELSLGAVDWTGVRDWHRNKWLFVLHIFEVPFYYIEYVIAQLGAVQMYMQYKEDPETALANYERALKLGRSKPLPEVYKAAGISFEFSDNTVKNAVSFIKKELEELK